MVPFIGEEAGVDPYVVDCDDPSESRATESSLWEVAALGRHWSPSVAEMARMLLEKDMTDRRKTGELNIELFSRESYTSMIEVELKKRLKRVPVAFFAKPPDRLFDASDMEGFPGWSLELPC
jgi:U3 small nucleolar RNA-associated protein 19